MITHRSFHGGQDILAVIRAGQCQDTLRLTLPITLFLEQPLQEAQGNFPQFLKTLSQLFELLVMVLRRAMFLADRLAAGLPQMERMPRDLSDVVVVNEQFGLGHADRENLAHPLPRHGVLIALLGNAAF